MKEKFRGEFVFDGFHNKYGFDIPIGQAADYGEMLVFDYKGSERYKNIAEFMYVLRESADQNYLAVRICSFGCESGEHDNRNGAKDKIYSIYLEGVWVDKERAMSFNPLPLDEYFVAKGVEKRQYGYTAVDEKLYGNIQRGLQAGEFSD